jgi:hypothetical protein
MVAALDALIELEPSQARNLNEKLIFKILEPGNPSTSKVGEGVAVSATLS